MERGERLGRAVSQFKGSFLFFAKRKPIKKNIFRRKLRLGVASEARLTKRAISARRKAEGASQELRA